MKIVGASRPVTRFCNVQSCKPSFHAPFSYVKPSLKIMTTLNALMHL